MTDQRFYIQDRVLVTLCCIVCCCTMGFCIFDKPFPRLSLVFFYGEIPACIVGGLLAWKLPRKS